MKEIPKDLPEIANNGWRELPDGVKAIMKPSNWLAGFCEGYKNRLNIELADCEYWKKKYEYMKKRCEAAEKLIEDVEQGVYLGEMNAYNAWSQLKYEGTIN
jgi:hypothetical protein